MGQTPKVNFDRLNLKAGKRERPDVSLEDVKAAREEVAPLGSSEKADEEVSMQTKTEQTPKSAKKDYMQLNLRLSKDHGTELQRVAALHGQPAQYVMRKLVDQWMKATADRREQIINK
jgi:hypothetical protein